MPTRFLILTNELPKLVDASGALASRFLLLVLTRSFFGREDLALTERLLGELPGILNWALEGRDRLFGRGFFLQPESAREALAELYDLTAPVRAFVEERCEVGRDKAVDRSVLFFAWSEWCREHGREKHGTIEQFGRDLRAVVPTIRRSQPRKDGDSSKDGERENFYVGIGLRPVMPPDSPPS